MISCHTDALGKVSKETRTDFSRARVPVLVLSYLVAHLDTVILILHVYHLQHRVIIKVANSIIQKLSESSLPVKT